ncbi:MAG: tellurite methyltransferase [Patiriisocius sp.]|jgi:tellurite methyltransferase
MKRKICGYYKDELDDWVAILDCYHGQHVRHKPPFTNRPWVETLEGRTEKLGFELDCVRCDRFEFPDNCSYYNKTPDFTETTIPPGLRKDHSTKTGTWGLIKVSEGQLKYVADEHQQVLSPLKDGIVVPNMLHHVEAIESVRFCVEFYRREKT